MLQEDSFSHEPTYLESKEKWKGNHALPQTTHSLTNWILFRPNVTSFPLKIKNISNLGGFVLSQWASQSIRVSQTQHSWYFGPDDSLLWALLCLVGCSLHPWSLPANNTSQLWQSKIPPDFQMFPGGSKIAHWLRTTAVNGCLQRWSVSLKICDNEF